MTKEEFARRLTNACDAVIQAEAEDRKSVV